MLAATLAMVVRIYPPWVGMGLRWLHPWPNNLVYVRKKPYRASKVRERQHGMQKLKSFRDAHSKMIRARNNPLKLHILAIFESL